MEAQRVELACDHTANQWQSSRAHALNHYTILPHFSMIILNFQHTPWTHASIISSSNTQIYIIFDLITNLWLDSSQFFWPLTYKLISNQAHPHFKFQRMKWLSYTQGQSCTSALEPRLSGFIRHSLFKFLLWPTLHSQK